VGENRRFEVPRPIDYALKEETNYLNSANIVGRESDIQTERFSYPVYSGPLLSDVLELDRSIVITAINATASAGGSYQISINGTTDIIASGSLTTTFNFPNWRLEVGETLNSSVVNAGIVWIGYYAD
jgi:hypothetical protein